MKINNVLKMLLILLIEISQRKTAFQINKCINKIK